MTWALKTVTQRGGTATITYHRMVTVEGEEVEEVHTVRHHRATFEGHQQTIDEWRANIRREIGADLSELNQADDLLFPVTITWAVNP